jgi:SAM-dependent methyltransferase
MKKANEKIIAWWNNEVDNGYGLKDEEVKNLINNPYHAFDDPILIDIIRKTFPDLNGVKICVPSSGGNEAVIAFCLLGAKVTSCDISERQLEKAETLAKKYGFDIEFVLDNTMTLDKIKSDEYDFVFTSNGVHVWIDDLKSMYENIHRILKKSGKYIMFEVHPINRPFEDCFGQLNIRKPYDDIGPLYDGINFHWRMQDIVNAIADSGLCIKRMEEMFSSKTASFFDTHGKTPEEIDQIHDWRVNPQAALPQWLTILAVK